MYKYYLIRLNSEDIYKSEKGRIYQISSDIISSSVTDFEKKFPKKYIDDVIQIKHIEKQLNEIDYNDGVEKNQPKLENIFGENFIFYSKEEKVEILTLICGDNPHLLHHFTYSLYDCIYHNTINKSSFILAIEILLNLMAKTTDHQSFKTFNKRNDLSDEEIKFNKHIEDILNDEDKIEYINFQDELYDKLIDYDTFKLDETQNKLIFKDFIVKNYYKKILINKSNYPILNQKLKKPSFYFEECFQHKSIIINILNNLSLDVIVPLYNFDLFNTALTSLDMKIAKSIKYIIFNNYSSVQPKYDSLFINVMEDYMKSYDYKNNNYLRDNIINENKLNYHGEKYFNKNFKKINLNCEENNKNLKLFSQKEIEVIKIKTNLKHLKLKSSSLLIGIDVTEFLKLNEVNKKDDFFKKEKKRLIKFNELEKNNVDLIKTLNEYKLTNEKLKNEVNETNVHKIATELIKNEKKLDKQNNKILINEKIVKKIKDDVKFYKEFDQFFFIYSYNNELVNDFENLIKKIETEKPNEDNIKKQLEDDIKKQLEWISYRWKNNHELTKHVKLIIEKVNLKENIENLLNGFDPIQFMKFYNVRDNAVSKYLPSSHHDKKNLNTSSSYDKYRRKLGNYRDGERSRALKINNYSKSHYIFNLKGKIIEKLDDIEVINNL